MAEKKWISLENFDQMNMREPILTSPRSLEACSRQGIDPPELIMRNLEEVSKIYDLKDMDAKSVEMVTKHYEAKRKEKLKAVIDDRVKLTDEIKAGIYVYEGDRLVRKMFGEGQHIDRSKESGLIEQEKKQLEKIRRRQEQEFKQMLDYENKMAQIEKSNADKLAIQKEKDRKAEQEMAQRRREIEEMKAEREAEKKRKAEKEAEDAARKMDEEHKKAQEREQNEKMKEKQRQLDAVKREEERRKKQEEFRLATEKVMAEQQAIIEKRKVEMEIKDKARREVLEKQREEKVKEAQELREHHEKKLREAKEKQEEKREKQLQLFDEKQKANELKRKLFEEEREKKYEEAKAEAAARAEEIKKVLVSNQELMEKKVSAYFDKEEQARLRKVELDKIAEEQHQKKIAEERQKEAQRIAVKDNNHALLQKKVETLVHKMDETDEKVRKAREKQEQERNEKKTLEFIRKMDKMENVKRIGKMHDYERKMLMERLMNNDERTDKVLHEREDILQTRKEMRNQMAKSKQELVERFEKLKKSKHDVSMLSAEMGMSATTGNMGNSSSQYRTSDLNNTTNLSKTEKVKQTSVQRKTFESSSKMNRTTQSPGQNASKTTLSGSSTAIDLKTVTLSKEALKLVEETRMNLNRDLLRVLEEEQMKEAKREEIYTKMADPLEKKKLEKTQATERANAQARIQQLSERNEAEISALIKKHSVVNKS